MPIDSGKGNMETLAAMLQDMAEVTVRWVRAQQGQMELEDTLAEFVVKHGRYFRPGSFPKGKGYRRGRAKECFFNSMKKAMKHGLIYVEGYGILPDTVPVPVEHAWCTDETGMAYEFTWKKSGLAYFGVPFDKTYLEEQYQRMSLKGELLRLIRHEEGAPGAASRSVRDGRPNGSLDRPARQRLRWGALI